METTERPAAGGALPAGVRRPRPVQHRPRAVPQHSGRPHAALWVRSVPPRRAVTRHRGVGSDRSADDRRGGRSARLAHQGGRGHALGDRSDPEEERELAARPRGGDRELQDPAAAGGRHRRRSADRRQADGRFEPGHPARRHDDLLRHPAARERHPYRDAGRLGARQVPHRRRPAAGDAADRQAASQHDHLAREGHGGARHRREARAAGRALQAAAARARRSTSASRSCRACTARMPSSASSTRNRSASGFASLRLDILGFPEEELRRFRKYIAEPYGMVLVTGPTGSGKTTTLYAALSEIKSIEDKIVTIEDPVEYQLPGHHADPDQREEGPDVRAGPALDPAPRSGQDHGRRDPRSRNGADRHPVGADGAPRVHDRPRQQRPRRARPLPEHGRRALSVRVGPQLRAGAAAGAEHLRALQARGDGHARAAPRVGPRSRARARRLLLRGRRAASSAEAPASRDGRRSASCWTSRTTSAR